MLQISLNNYSKLFSKYTELRVQENRTLQIAFVKGNLVKNSKDASSGVSAMVCDNGSWGFASSAELKDDNIQAVLKRAKENAEAGIKECILESNLAGTLAHEAIGHTTEADIVLGGSVAADNLEKQVASPIINLTDFAHSYNGEICPVPIYMDDEGTKGEDVVIIKDGILKSFMHNKESAQYFSVKPTGNARAYQFFDEPLIRMRNTAILPGTSKLNDMIASIEDGYYLMESSNGQADSISEFMFGLIFMLIHF